MRTDVNAGFCKQVLKDIDAKKAPYWIEGELSENAEKGTSCVSYFYSPQALTIVYAISR